MRNDFYKFYDKDAETGKIVRVAKAHYVLLFGNGTDENDAAYVWRKDYDHLPDKAEARADIDGLVNGLTDAKILSGFKWEGMPVWLSAENQFNFKCAYDIAVQTSGASLPAKYKLGEDDEGHAVYHTFETVEDFADFYFGCVEWVQQCINEGWEVKDGVDYDAMFESLND